jgi:hypothetical protein
MSFDDASAGDNQAGRIESETSQRAGRLADQHALIPARGPGHVAEPLDRMHHPRRYCHIGACDVGALPSAAVASNPALNTKLTSLGGESRPLEEWLTTFHLASVVLDPYTNESSWVLKTAARILESLRGTDARVNFVVTADAEGAKAFLGPLTEDFLVYCDPDRAFVRTLGLLQLPAFVFIRLDGTLQACAEGWNAAEWRAVAEQIATTTAWISPTIPVAGDPGPFNGTPALG